ncbi:MAG: uracil-DNA glycosylase family protein [Planctomycetes bacterium]|nr:uracil-DNA glycosylase family protein [Planctomycetota bacterium]
MTAPRLAPLLAAIEAEARRAPFDVCLDTYRAAGRDPAVPIVCAGSLDAPFAALGRELGREEVHAGEPLIGMGGRRFRRAFHDAVLAKSLGPAPKSERRFDAIFDHVLLTNTVPYRPVDNVAYDRATLVRFRPFVETLLADLWRGHTVLALGETATRWFAPYAAPGAVDALWADADRRFTDTIDVEIRGRAIRVAPIPHPSPLSPFKKEFARLLALRTEAGQFFVPRNSSTDREQPHA